MNVRFDKNYIKQKKVKHTTLVINIMVQYRTLLVRDISIF